ncbi:MAG TPA: MerR family transcriptional regulator [Sandaracinaceae bacterium]
MRIGELSERTGVSVRSLRHYESRGLIEAKRRSNGYREFDESVVERIHRIRSLLAIGFTIDDILPFAPCLDDEAFDERRACDEAIALYRAKLEEIDQRIRELVRLREQLPTRLEALAPHGAADGGRTRAAAVDARQARQALLTGEEVVR